METTIYQQNTSLFLGPNDRLAIRSRIDSLTDEKCRHEALKAGDIHLFQERIDALELQLKIGFRSMNCEEIIAIRYCLGGKIGTVPLDSYSDRHGPMITEEAANAVIQAKKILPIFTCYYVWFYDPDDIMSSSKRDDPVIIAKKGYATYRSHIYFISSFGEKVNTLQEMVMLYRNQTPEGEWRDIRCGPYKTILCACACDWQQRKPLPLRL